MKNETGPAKKLLCPSMMCADFGHLKREIDALSDAGADMLHLDLMDGSFVPNYALGLSDIEYIVKHSRIPADLHLMVRRPDRYIERFARMGVKLQYIHPATVNHPARTLLELRGLGCEAGLALDPHVPVGQLEPLLPLCDYVLVMGVNPGFAGQSYLPFTDQKLRQLVERKSAYPFKIVLDGACTPERIASLSRAGVDGFVLGTSALFGKEGSYAEILAALSAV